MNRQMITEQIKRAEKIIQSSTLEWFIQMNHVREALDGYMVCMETKAQGETAESVSSYIEDIHKYLLNQFYSLFAEMNSRIIQYAREISKESSENMQKNEDDHLKADFEAMEKRMTALENLMKECRETGAARIRCYQKGNIRNFGEVWELEQISFHFS